MNSNKEWYKSAFDAEYSQVYSHRTDQSASTEIQWIMKEIDKNSQTSVLDLCCGNGRHTTELSNQGLNVIGFDLSAPLLQQANCRTTKTTENYVRGDMRQLPFLSNQFSLIVSLFTSFGYFSTDAENLAVLQEIQRTLTPQGQVFLDFLNAPWVISHLIPRSEEIKDDFHLLQERSITSDGKRVEKKITYNCAGKPKKTYYESVRLFTIAELKVLFDQANLNITGTYGSLYGDAYTHQSPRVVLKAQK